MDSRVGEDGAISIPVHVTVTPKKPRRVFCDPLSAHKPGMRFRHTSQQSKISAQLPSVETIATPEEMSVTADVIVPMPERKERKKHLQILVKKMRSCVKGVAVYTFNLLRGARVQLQTKYAAAHALYQGSSQLRVWQVSMTFALFVGMISVSVVYKNFGTDVYASNGAHTLALDPMTVMILEGGTRAISGELPITDAIPVPDHGTLPLAEVDDREDRSPEQIAFEERAQKMVAGHPIERMLPEIFTLDREVASYVLAIAKIESNWGKRVPVLDGEDCFNYWGYRATRDRMGSGGHTCFDSPADGVRTVGKRIHSLVYDYERVSPREMLVWKCGSTCAGHSTEGVERWVGVVGHYRDIVREG